MNPYAHYPHARDPTLQSQLSLTTPNHKTSPHSSQSQAPSPTTFNSTFKQSTVNNLNRINSHLIFGPGTHIQVKLYSGGGCSTHELIMNMREAVDGTVDAGYILLQLEDPSDPTFLYQSVITHTLFDQLSNSLLLRDVSFDSLIGELSQYLSASSDTILFEFELIPHSFEAKFRIRAKLNVGSGKWSTHWNLPFKQASEKDTIQFASNAWMNERQEKVTALNNLEQTQFLLQQRQQQWENERSQIQAERKQDHALFEQKFLDQSHQFELEKNEINRQFMAERQQFEDNSQQERMRWKDERAQLQSEMKAIEAAGADKVRELEQLLQTSHLGESETQTELSQQHTKYAALMDQLNALQGTYDQEVTDHKNDLVKYEQKKKELKETKTALTLLGKQDTEFVQCITKNNEKIKELQTKVEELQAKLQDSENKLQETNTLVQHQKDEIMKKEYQIGLLTQGKVHSDDQRKSAENQMVELKKEMEVKKKELETKLSEQVKECADLKARIDQQADTIEYQLKEVTQLKSNQNGHSSGIQFQSSYTNFVSSLPSANSFTNSHYPLMPSTRSSTIVPTFPSPTSINLPTMPTTNLLTTPTQPAAPQRTPGSLDFDSPNTSPGAAVTSHSSYQPTAIPATSEIMRKYRFPSTIAPTFNHPSTNNNMTHQAPFTHKPTTQPLQDITNQTKNVTLNQSTKQTTGFYEVTKHQPITNNREVNASTVRRQPIQV